MRHIVIDWNSSMYLLTALILLGLTVPVIVVIYKTAHPVPSTWLESGIDQINDMKQLPWQFEEVTFKGHGGTLIHGCILKAETRSLRRTFVLIHGHRKNMSQMLGRALLLHNMGYNLLLIDYRHHGKSERDRFGLGYFGRFDLEIIIDQLKNEIFPGTEIGVFGISLGATTALACHGSTKKIDCIIADSPSSDQTLTLCEYAKRLYKAPFWFSRIMLSIMEVIYQMDFDELDIEKVMKTKGWKNIPILILHGNKDNRVPIRHAIRILNILQANSPAGASGKTTSETRVKLLIFDQANHVEGYSLERERYDNEVQAFLSDNFPESM